jgi:oligopeptidase B
VHIIQEAPNQRLLAWTEDVEGGEKYDVRVKDLVTGREVTGPIPNTSGSVMWANDNAHLVRG